MMHADQILVVDGGTLETGLLKKHLDELTHI